MIRVVGVIDAGGSAVMMREQEQEDDVVVDDDEDCLVSLSISLLVGSMSVQLADRRIH